MTEYCQCNRFPGETLSIDPSVHWTGIPLCRRCGKVVLYQMPKPLAKICPKNDRIYLASPYTSDNVMLAETRYQLALHAAAILANAGYIVYSPIAYTHVMATRYNIQPTDSNWWVDFDESFVKNWATVIATLMIPGYKESSGISREIDMARDAGLLEIHLTMEKLYDISRAGSIRLD